MSLLKKITKIILNILTTLLLVLLVIVIYGKVVITFSDNAYPNYFGYTLFEVASGSMQPTLQINDVVVVKISKENLKQNDIIAFVDKDAIITHRILYIDDNVITVKGDNNNAIDTPILSDVVIGKVIKILPKLGIWKKVLTEPRILLAIFITLLLFDFALSYNPDEKPETKKSTSNKKNTDIIKKPEVKKDKPVVKKKDITESNELLESTRKIELKELNGLLDNPTIEIDARTIRSLKQGEKSNSSKTKETKKEEQPVKNEEQKKALDYTKRMDLNEIHDMIDKKMK